MALKTWRCPKCGYEIKAMGSEATHTCPVNKRTVQLVEVKE